MFPIRLEISQVRGIDHLDVPIQALTTLIGPNNSGKSTVLDAIRLFYGDLDWDDARDRPWRDGTAGGSSVTISFDLDEDDLPNVRGHADDYTLRLRRQFTDTALGRAGTILSLDPGFQTGGSIGVDGDGADPAPPDLAQWPGPPPGACVYIPALADTAGLTRMAESAALRGVLSRALHDKSAHQAIQEVTAGLEHLRATLAHENGPVAHLERQLSGALEPWGLRAAIEVAGLTPDLVVDHLLRLEVLNDGQRAPITSQGTGVQRIALAALIQAVAELDDAAPGDFTWILFEEPETHLHPAQVRTLGAAFGRETRHTSSAVMITTHDMTMLAGQSRLDTVVRLHHGTVAAPSRADVTRALDAIRLRSAYTDHARRRFSGTPRQADRGQTRHRLLRELDTRRSAALFADRVIVAEGYSDCAFFEWLDQRRLLDPLGPNLAFLDANGKYELHRAITTLSLYGVPHVVIWDEDAALVPVHETAKHQMRARQDEAVWQAIRAAVRDSHDHVADPPYPAPCRFTAGGIRLAGTIESWLGVHEEGENAWKAANLASALDDYFDDPRSGLRNRIMALVTLLADMFDTKPMDIHRGYPQFSECLIAPPFPLPSVDFTGPPAE